VDRHSPDRLYQRAVRLSWQTRPLPAGGCPHNGSPRQTGSHHQGAAGAGRQPGGYRHRRREAPAIQGTVRPSRDCVAIETATLVAISAMSLMAVLLASWLSIIQIYSGRLPANILFYSAIQSYCKCARQLCYKTIRHCTHCNNQRVCNKHRKSNKNNYAN